MGEVHVNVANVYVMKVQKLDIMDNFVSVMIYLAKEVQLMISYVLEMVIVNVENVNVMSNGQERIVGVQNLLINAFGLTIKVA